MIRLAEKIRARDRLRIEQPEGDDASFHAIVFFPFVVFSRPMRDPFFFSLSFSFSLFYGHLTTIDAKNRVSRGVSRFDQWDGIKRKMLFERILILKVYRSCLSLIVFNLGYIQDVT